MKKVWVLFSAMILLTGCVSGGGGSGSASSGGGGGAPTPPPVNADSVFGVGSKVVTVDTSNGSKNFQINKTADGLTLISNNGQGRSVTVNSGDFVADSSYFVASKETIGTYSDDPSTSYRATDEIALGGKRLGLSHSDFGMWDAHDKRYQAGTEIQRPTEYTYTPLTMGDDSKKANFASSGSGQQIFSGTTVAIAHGGGTSEIKHLLGTAGLAIDPANLNGSTLYIDLPNFADFTISVGIDPSGTITERPGLGYVSIHNKVTDKLLSNPNADVTGQFYGDSPASPSEAVGSYTITSSDAPDPTIVNGSFGVKKQP